MPAPSPVTVMASNDVVAPDANAVAAPDTNNAAPDAPDTDAAVDPDADAAVDPNHDGSDVDADDSDEETCANRVAWVIVAAVFGVLPPLLGAVLMIVSQYYSWKLLLLMWPADRPFGWLMPVCFGYWVWACKNRAFGPTRADPGVLTFLPGYLAGSVSFLLPVGRPGFVFTMFAFASTLFPAAHHLMHVFDLHKECAGRFAAFSLAKLKARYSVGDRHFQETGVLKPTFWVVTFVAYVHTSTLFWLVAGVVGGVRGHASGYAMLAGLGVGLANAPLMKMAADKMNASGRMGHEGDSVGVELV